MLARIVDHLQGCYTLGMYLVDRDGMCSCAVFDADSEDGLDRLVLLAEELAALRISSVVEASRRGGHLWVFLDGPVLARVVRLWLLPYAQRYGVELYPKQDRVRPSGVGNLVRLPLGVHRRSGEWYPFLMVGAGGVLYPVGETVAECCRWVGQSAERAQVPEEYQQVEQFQDDQCVVMGGAGRGESVRPGRGVIEQWCASQDIVEVIGRYTDLDRRGVGRCPLPGHHYRGDVHPSFQVFGGTDPHWYCYTWGRAGDLFDFLRFYHGLTVREAWERLQQGILV
jgi:hypothetical protein